MVPERENRLRRLYESLTALTDGQLGWIETVASQFHKPAHFQRLPNSNLVNDCILQDFGDALRIHHCFSKEPFSKDKFEYAFERVLNLCAIPAMLAQRGNPGHDITIDGVRFSLKTQADRNLALGRLHISKFMELGRGAWTDKDEDLIGLRAQFLRHMESYDRILSLRRLPATAIYTWHYELVEIPKSLLEGRNLHPPTPKGTDDTVFPGKRSPALQTWHTALPVSPPASSLLNVFNLSPQMI